jgi:CRP-like cAMP-binding protein
MKLIDLIESGRPVNLSAIESGLDRDGATTRNYSERTTIFEPADHNHRMFFIKSGWVMTYKFLPSGTRIVTDFLLRGDMMSTTVAKLSQETIQAVTEVTVSEFPDVLSDGDPHAISSRHSRIVLMELLRRQARMSERLANIGGRDGLERTAHLLLELAFRARHIKKSNLDGFVCPLRQADIGDAVGLSTVHANRVLKDMRVNGLLWFRNGIVEFPDRQRLMDAVHYNPNYLSMDSLL